jgi:hypothetical protein
MRLRELAAAYAHPLLTALPGTPSASSPPKEHAAPHLETPLAAFADLREVVGIGNGAFTPAHDVNSMSTLIPTAFGPFHTVVTDLQGNVLAEFAEPRDRRRGGFRYPGPLISPILRAFTEQSRCAAIQLSFEQLDPVVSAVDTRTG